MEPHSSSIVVKPEGVFKDPVSGVYVLLHINHTSHYEPLSAHGPSVLKIFLRLSPSCPRTPKVSSCLFPLRLTIPKLSPPNLAAAWGEHQTLGLSWGLREFFSQHQRKSPSSVCKFFHAYICIYL